MITEASEAKLTRLSARLAILEAEGEIRRVMARYTHLCDWPGQPLGSEFRELFAPDAIWEGVGSRYAGKYGRHEGRERIMAFFEGLSHGQPPFQFNAHFLTSESIEVEGSSAIGGWMLLQPYTSTRGESSFVGARLRIAFRLDSGRWRIAHFRTENLFSRAELSAWDSGGSHPRAAGDGK